MARGWMTDEKRKRKIGSYILMTCQKSKFVTEG